MSITYKNVDVLGGQKVCMGLLSGGKKVSALTKKLGKCPKLEQGESLLLIAQPKLKDTSVVLMKVNAKKLTSVEDMRHLGGKFYSASKASKASKLAISFSNFSELFGENAASFARGFMEGAMLSNYSTQEGKSKPKKTTKTSFEIYHKGADADELKDLKAQMKEATATVDAVHFTRNLGDLPGNMMTPTILGEKALSLKANGLKVTVWDKKRIQKENMGCLLGVAAGSSEEPRFIIMEHKHKDAPKGQPTLLVGKGLTFDAGGISIKPSGGMDEMRYDMCGGAAVIGAMKLISEMNLPVHVIGVVPSTENLLGASACKPGDILTAMNGKTVEVLNTDAEGRLILADALCYASTLKPKQILNTATLTGAMVVALGNVHTGFYTRNDELASDINLAAAQSGENVWRMPLTDDHQSDMKGRFADLSNMSSSRGAGSATAAAFLENFCDDEIPFAHLDMAGTAWNSGRKSYNSPKTATGVLVRTFYEFVKTFA